MLRGDRGRGPAPASWGFSRRWAATSWHLGKPTRDGRDLSVGSAYGVVHCPVFDCDKELALYNWRRAVVSAETMLAYDDLVGGDETPLDAAGRAFAELRIKNADISSLCHVTTTLLDGDARSAVHLGGAAGDCARELQR